MDFNPRKYFGSQNKSTVKAVAVVSNATFHKPLINLYMKFSRPSIPTKFFDDEASAISFLEQELGK